MATDDSSARARLADVIVRLRQMWLSSGQSNKWTAFFARFLRPALTGQPPISYQGLSEACRDENPEAICSLLADIRQQFRQALADSTQTPSSAGDPLVAFADSLRSAPAVPRGSDREITDSSTDDAIRSAIAAAGTDDLLKLLENQPAQWTDADLETMWRHQLRLPVADQVDLPRDLMELTYSPLGGGDPAEWALGELLHHSCPAVPWLQGVERYAKRKSREGCLPRPIASSVYLTAIAAAIAHRAAHITRSSDDVLRLGISSTLSLNWIDDQTRSLLQNALSKLRPPEEDSRLDN